MREKLKNVLRNRLDYPNGEDIEEIVDAILDTLLEPSEGMLEAGLATHCSQSDVDWRDAWQAMVRKAGEE